MTCRLIDYDSPYLDDQNFTEDDISRANSFCEAATAAVEKACHRHFLLAEYDEVCEADLTGSILLDNFPLVRVARAYSTDRQAAILQNTDSTVTNASFYTDSTAVTLSYTVDGAVQETALSWQNYPTVADLVTAINGVGSGWSASVRGGYGPYASADLVADQYGECKSQNEFRIWAQTGARWAVADKGQALLEGEFEREQAVRIVYTAGFAADEIPEDLKKLVADLVKDMVSAGQGHIQSESIGDYSYTLAQNAVERLPLSNKDVLGHYKDRIV